MITVAEIIEIIIRETPFLEEGIAEGIINLSALARKIKPQVESKLMKPVSESALIMALKRMAPKIEQKVLAGKRSVIKMGDITVRSDLSEFTFSKSDTLLSKEKMLLDELHGSANPFITFTQGVFENTVIVNSNLEESVERIFKGERLVSRLRDLAAVTIRLTPETVHTPGVHYSILKQLAWHNINVVEVVSTYTEFTIIIQNEQVDTSFSILLKFLTAKK